MNKVSSRLGNNFKVINNSNKSFFTRRSGSADGIYIELSAHDRLCTRQWSTKILSVQSKYNKETVTLR